MPYHVYLGHGASGSAASMEPFVAGLRRRGVAATAIDLPKRRAEDAVPALLRVVPPGEGTIIGGHSYGGRVASLAAAADGRGELDQPPFAGLVVFSYPLHRPGAPDAETRAAHWTDIACPVLLLSGESDPFARIGLLRAAVTLLTDAELVTYPGLGHSVRPVLEDALDRAAAFVHRLESR